MFYVIGYRISPLKMIVGFYTHTTEFFGMEHVLVQYAM